jgi:response regulator RpfG family c-di-GMP phosphodiesterase
MDQIPGLKHAEKTILIVDDDTVSLATISGFLNGQYNVLVAKNGADAVLRSEEYQDEIHLLLTAFSMPEMTGMELASKINLQRPDVKVLLMSPFPDGMLVLNEGWHFMPTSFIESQLRTLVTSLIAPTSRFSRVAAPA